MHTANHNVIENSLHRLYGTVSALTEIPEDPIIENVETKIG